MNWDDFRVASAVLVHGSYVSAAKQLRIDETTVSRRIDRLEQSLGFSLFDAVDGQRVPTKAGEETLTLIGKMQCEAEKIGNIASSDRRPVVSRRIASPDSIAANFLIPTLPDFIAENQDISLEILISAANANLARWETDIALRLVRPEQGDFTISKLGEIDVMFVGPANELPRLACGVSLRHTSAEERAAFLSKCGETTPVVAIDNLPAIRDLVALGGVCAFLPHYMCAEFIDDPHFKVEPTGLARPLWLLVQTHLCDDLPTRRIIDWMRSVVTLD